MILLNFLLGLVLSTTIAVLAYWRGLLSSSGMVGAIGVGTLVFAMGGIVWGLLLIAFFVTSSALSHYQARVKEPLADKFQKGHRRDLGQVLANGGWGAFLALAFGIAPHPLLFVAFVGAMAAVTADTWATELGVLSKTPPRLITTGRVVPVGTSGAITPLGTFAALGGTVLIGLLAVISVSLFPDTHHALRITHHPSAGSGQAASRITLLLLVSLCGLLGSLFDSLLGATVQAIYFCDLDQKETEAARHRCGRTARRIRGWHWLDNDWVNFLTSVVGSMLAVAGYWVVGRF